MGNTRATRVSVGHYEGDELMSLWGGGVDYVLLRREGSLLPLPTIDNPAASNIFSVNVFNIYTVFCVYYTQDIADKC